MGKILCDRCRHSKPDSATELVTLPGELWLSLICEDCRIALKLRKPKPKGYRVKGTAKPVYNTGTLFAIGLYNKRRNKRGKVNRLG